MIARVLIADDHAIVREGLKMVLESSSDIKVVGEAIDCFDAVEKAVLLNPDVVLMDISMPGLNGIEATRMIMEKLPSTRIIILSMQHTAEHVFQAMQAGASGYILKESATASVFNAIRSVMKGRKYFTEEIEATGATRFNTLSVSKSPLDSLTRRERQTLQLVVEGNTNSTIAEILDISIKSVETYRSRLMLKLDIDNVPSLVKFALQNGITSL